MNMTEPPDGLRLFTLLVGRPVRSDTGRGIEDDHTPRIETADSALPSGLSGAVSHQVRRMLIQLATH